MIDKVKVNRLKLLEMLKTNRTKHVDDFNKAVEDYRKSLLVDVSALWGQLEEHDLSYDQLAGLSLHFAVPQSHAGDYDLIIQMMEMSVDETIELDQANFQQYVMDNWAWKRLFTTMNGMYATKAMSLSS